MNEDSNWRQIPIWTAVSVYWVISVFSSQIQKLLGLGEGDGVWVIAATFFLIVIICMITQRTGWRLWKRIVYLPASFLAHVILTIPSSAALGILMRTVGRERTVAEQRAVFLLASIPILVYSMRQSYLFIRTEKTEASEEMCNPQMEAIRRQ
jgi:lysylphosphatidylglycerol synthetase-like protein (DUF2156 family)